MFLIFGSWTVVTYEIPKVIAFQWFVRFLVLVLAVSFFKKPKKWKVDGKVSKSVLAFTGIAIVSSILGVNITKSFTGNFYRGDGLITFLSLVGFAFVVSYFWKEEFNKYFAEVIFWTSTLLSGFYIVSTVTPQLSHISAAGFGNSVFLAGFLVTALPFSFFYLREKTDKYLRLGLFVQVISLFFMSATAAVIVLFVYALMLVGRFVKIGYRRFLAVGLVVAALATGFVWVRNYRLESSKSLIAEGRARIFINGLQGFASRPVLGYGWSNFDAAFQKGTWPIKLNNDVYVDKAHSEFLEVLVSTGVVGVSVYLALLFVLYKKFKSISNTNWGFTLFSVFVIYVLHSQTNVISISEQILFWFGVGHSLRSS